MMEVKNFSATSKIQNYKQEGKLNILIEFQSNKRKSIKEEGKPWEKNHMIDIPC